jgi:NAD dependent epimerase/dehydratase family
LSQSQDTSDLIADVITCVAKNPLPKIPADFIKMIVVTSITVLLPLALVSGFSLQPGCRIATQARPPSALAMSKALIVQNKGGGHGELGYQLAKVLVQHEKISSVTILQDEARKEKSEPFASYSTDLPTVSVITAPLGDESMTSAELQSRLGGPYATFDYVWDNASKGDTGAGKAVIDCARSWNVKLHCYVSSAGMYKPSSGTAFPMDETTPIKESAGQNMYDQYAASLGLPLVSFRPQYIYGPKSNKHDYVDWFFDRLVRRLPLPIPGDGNQLVSLTNSEDVATLLASPLNDENAAISQRYFNCGTDQLVSQPGSYWESQASADEFCLFADFLQ